MKTNKTFSSNDWINWIGQDVIKHSKKPFKSGYQIGTVVDKTINPHSGKEAFKMNDDSIVDCYQVKLKV
jgi:hypothetical protein